MIIETVDGDRIGATAERVTQHHRLTEFLEGKGEHDSCASEETCCQERFSFSEA